MNSPEVLNALYHPSVRHASILPRMWRSTAIVANMDHNQSVQDWFAFYIDGTRTYFDNYSMLPLDSRFFLQHRQTLPRIAGTRRFKKCFLKLVDNTAVYFYILYVIIIILASFLVCLPLIVNAMTE